MGFRALFTSALVVFTGEKLFLEVNQGHAIPTDQQVGLPLRYRAISFKFNPPSSIESLYNYTLFHYCC